MLLRRKWLCFFIAVLVGFFVINILIISHYIDLSSHLPKTSAHQNVAVVKKHASLDSSHRLPTLTSSSTWDVPILNEIVPMPKKCERVNDSLSVSAYDRMQTKTCRDQMVEFLCAMNRNVGWAVEHIDNTCISMFNKSQIYVYGGCYKDTPSSRLLQGFKYELKTNNAPSVCVQTCLRTGFKYAGVEYSTECFCGSTLAVDFMRRRIEDEKCNTHACPGTEDLQCGGFQALALYSTGITEIEKPLPVYHALPDEILSPSLLKPKILFLLQLNGRNTRQIMRLLKLLYRPHHLYYIHVDARQSYMQQEMLNVEQILQENFGLWNLRVAGGSARYSTIWGGSSLLNMFLTVIKTTFSMNGDWSLWDYVLNLSETDMPLLSIEELEYNLISNMGKSFLSSHGYNTANFVQKQGFNYVFMECEKRMWRIGSRKNFPNNMRLDGGSDWVIVHRDLAAFAVDEKSHLAIQLQHLFSTILLPLESFFHTLALNSKFCTRILYRNLRLTNWRRKQGCRCGWLRHIVDWCGCSPLVIRHTERRFDVQNCKARMHFFARKFDSTIDAETIAQAERQVLRFHPKHFRQMWEASPSFNATWQNLFRADIDETPDSTLYNNWFRSVIRSQLIFINKHMLTHGCEIGDVFEVFTYKADETTSLQIGASAPFTCSINNDNASYSAVEVLLTRRYHSRLATDTIVLVDEGKRRWAFALSHIDFGLSLDLKEDVLRQPSGLIQIDATISFLWFWRARELLSGESLYRNFHSMNISRLPVNHTSPPVTVQVWAPFAIHDIMHLIHVKSISSYDSINYAQYIELSLPALMKRRPNSVPVRRTFTLKCIFTSSTNEDYLVLGVWTAKILSQHGVFLGEIEFPVYPKAVTDNFNEFFFSQLTDHFYEVVDVCQFSRNVHNMTNADRAVKQCRDTPWSTHFPDMKSEITHGYDYTLGMLV